MKKNAGRLAALLLSSVLTAAVLPELTLHGAEALTFEFDKTEGGKLYTKDDTQAIADDEKEKNCDLSGFSGDEFIWIDQKNTTAVAEVTVPAAGLYQMTVRYCQPSDVKKIQYLNINGVNQGEINFPNCMSFREIDGGIVMLPEGTSTIELRGYWGYTYIDCLTLEPAPSYVTDLKPTAQLCDPDATETTRRLYQYLCDNYGKHIISGQQENCNDHNFNLWADPDNYIKDNEAEFEYLQEVTGLQPAIRGIDFLSYRSGSDWQDHAAERARQWFNEYHGIVALTYHWSVPSDPDDQENAAFYVQSASANYTTFSAKNALEEGTWEHEQLLKDIDKLADRLQLLADADVPVLFRPFHEAEGAWFWWGAEGPEACVGLYRLLYDKLTNEYGLHNLIWVWTSGTYETSAAWYPGDDVVDLLGYDKYNCTDGQPNLSSIGSAFYTLVASRKGQKMVAMTENDSIPSLENLQNDKAAWLWFCPWYGNFLTSEQNNPANSLKEIYQSEYCITLDELPDIRTYPLSGQTEQPSEKPTEASTEQATQPATEVGVSNCGDVDCNGKVNILDVITLNKHLMVGETITASGRENAITRKGATEPAAADALNILKYIVRILETLPVA